MPLLLQQQKPSSISTPLAASGEAKTKRCKRRVVVTPTNEQYHEQVEFNTDSSSIHHHHHPIIIASLLEYNHSTNTTSKQICIKAVHQCSSNNQSVRGKTITRCDNLESRENFHTTTTSNDCCLNNIKNNIKNCSSNKKQQTSPFIPDSFKKILLICIAIILCFLVRNHHVEGGHSLSSYDWINEDEIWFAQSAPFTGPSASLGIELRNGILAAFNEINSVGGIYGRKKLRLLSEDDGYEPQNTIRNVNRFLNGDRPIFGLIGVIGSPTTQAIFDTVVSSNLPLIGSYTGATFLREPFHANIINIRPSYFDETAALLDVLISKNMVRKISVFYQDDLFGQNGFEGVKRVLNRMNLPLCSYGSYQRNTEKVDTAFYEIAKCDPDSIIIIALYGPAVKFIRMVTSSTLYRPNLLFASTSIGSDLIVRELGFNISSRILFSQVTPSPTDTSSALVRSFINARSILDSNFTLGTFIELEGYIAAKLTYHLLQRILGVLSPDNFVKNLYYSQEVVFDNFKLGPFSSATVYDPIYSIESNFSSQINCNQGSKTVWRTKVNANLTFSNYQPAFSWYTTGACIVQPDAVTNPLLFAQLVYEKLGTSNDFLTNGIKAAMSVTTIKGRPIHLLTRKYSDTKTLMEQTIDLIENYHIIGIVGCTGIGEVLTNSTIVDQFKIVLKSKYSHIPIIGTVVDNPNIMGTTGSGFVPSIINIRNTVIEEIGSLLQFAFSKGYTRFSIVNCPNYQHINIVFKQLMDQLGLTVESQHACADNINFKKGAANPQVLLVACASSILASTLAKIELSSQFRSDGIYFVLEEKKNLVQSNLGIINRTIMYSSPFPGTENRDVTIVSRFKSILPPISNIEEYLVSDLALEGFFLGEFIYLTIESISDSTTDITGGVLLDFVYNNQQLVIRDQKYGYFNRDSRRYSLCNIGLRDRYLFQIRKYSTTLVSSTTYSQQQCCLQAVLENTGTLSLKRPIQLIRMRKSDTELLTIDPIDDFSMGVLTSLNHFNKIGKYSYEFQFLTQTYNDSSDIIMLAKELVFKQQIFGILGPDVDSNINEFTDLNIPIIGPTCSAMTYREFKNNTINIFPSAVDETFNLVSYFLTFTDSISIVFDTESTHFSDCVSRIEVIISNKRWTIPITCLTCVEPTVLAGRSVIILADIEKVYGFLSRNKGVSKIGLMSEAFSDQEKLQDILLQFGSVFATTILPLSLSHASFVESEFGIQFKEQFPTSSYSVDTIYGFVSFLFVEKVFESFIDRILPSQQQLFLEKVYSLSLFDIGDIGLGRFSPTCNQGTRKLYISEFMLSNNTILVDTPTNSLFTFDTCGYSYEGVQVMDYLYYVLISIFCLAFLMVVSVVVFVLSYRLYKTKKSHQHAPKGGTMSFVFTDIQNSTVLWQTNEKAMKLALAIHNKIVRENIKRHRGYEVKTQGDSFFVAFRRADDAVHWALSVQSDLLKASWPSDIITQYDCRPEFEEATKTLFFSGLRVRMGLHCGPAEYIFDKTVKRPDYFGHTINQTARIQSLARGGEILCSEALLSECSYLFKVFGPYGSDLSDELLILSLQQGQNMSRKSSEANILSRKRKSTTTVAQYTAEDFGYCTLKGIKEDVKVFTLKNNDMNLRVFLPVGKMKPIEELSLTSTPRPSVETTLGVNGDIIIQIPDQDSSKSDHKTANSSFNKIHPIELNEITLFNENK